MHILYSGIGDKAVALHIHNPHCLYVLQAAEEAAELLLCQIIDDCAAGMAEFGFG